MPAPLMLPPKAFPCNHAGCGKSFTSQGSLGSHVRWHTMTPAKRRAAHRKRAATMKMNRLESQVPEATAATATKARRPPRKFPAPAPGGNGPTFSDAIAFLEVRRDLLTDTINDLKRMQSGVHHQ